MFKKCEIFSGIFALKFCEFRRFFSRQKPAFLFPAKNLRQPRFTAPRSGMSQKSRRKVAELRRRTFFFFFFFGEQRKIGEKNASIGVMTFFFFLEITFKPDKNDEKIFGIFTLILERSHQCWSTRVQLEYHFLVLVLGTPGTRLVLVLEGQCTRYSVKKRAEYTSTFGLC